LRAAIEKADEPSIVGDQFELVVPRAIDEPPGSQPVHLGISGQHQAHPSGDDRLNVGHESRARPAADRGAVLMGRQRIGQFQVGLADIPAAPSAYVIDHIAEQPRLETVGVRSALQQSADENSRERWSLGIDQYIVRNFGQASNGAKIARYLEHHVPRLDQDRQRPPVATIVIKALPRGKHRILDRAERLILIVIVS
jgi:hypothetical protein